MHGLPLRTRDLQDLRAAIAAAPRSADATAQLDAKADAFFRIVALAYTRGAVDPAVVDPAWAIPRPNAADIESLLDEARGGDTGRLLLGLLPQDQEYVALERGVASVMSEPAGNLDAGGLTRETRLAHLRSSLERRRWLPRALPEPRIEVRVPLFDARLFGTSEARHRVIVGARRTPTPSFFAQITSVTINPEWRPPAQIVRNELLPLFRRNPRAAAAEGFELYDQSGRPVAWSDADLTRLHTYMVRQKPGPQNALGRLRFDMANPYAIFMHDTPGRRLFDRADRALSHGCIRTEEPIALARAALDADAWTEDAIVALIARKATHTIDLAMPLPVFVLYLTAAEAGDGAITYGADIYGRDAILLAALDRASDGGPGLGARPAMSVACR